MDNTLGERVLLLRRRCGLTQKALARAVALDANTIARLERGRVRMLRGDTVAALAVALATSSDFLLGLRSTPEPWSCEGSRPVCL